MPVRSLFLRWKFWTRSCGTILLFSPDQSRLRPADHRRNLTVLGVPLNHLVGKRFRVGDVVLFGGRLNFPCKYLEKLLGLPVYLPLYNRSGLNCVIEKAGVIRRGDPIEPLDAY